MAGFIASLILWSFAITLVALTATYWSGRINAIVPEPYLVRLPTDPRIILMQAG